MHVLIMELFGSGRLGFRLDAITNGALFGVLVTWVLTLICSILVILVIKRIPYLRILVP